MLNKKALFAILFTIFNISISWAVALPILPPLFFDHDYPIFASTTPDQTRSLTLIGLFASYSLFQSLILPWVGLLTDTIGRKKVLLWTILGEIAAFLITAYAIKNAHLSWLLIGRLLSGLCAGGGAAAQATIADVSTEQNKASNLALAAIVGGISWIIGPLLAALLSNSSLLSWFNPSFPFFFIAALFALNFVWVARAYQETYIPVFKTNSPLSLHHFFSNFSGCFAINRKAKTWLGISFLFNFCWLLFMIFFPILFAQEFRFSTAKISLYSGSLAAFFLLGSLAIHLHKNQSPTVLKNGVFWSFLTLAICTTFGNWIASPNGWLIFFPPIGLSASFAAVNLTTLVSNAAGKEIQGEIFSLLQSVTALALLSATLIAGVLQTMHVTLPFYVESSILLGLAFLTRSLLKREN